MKILLTGSTGQVGHALLQTLAPFSDIVAPTRAQCDLSQAESVRETIRQYQPDLIINPAAYTAVDKAESEPELAHAINAIAPKVMAEEAKKLGIGLIHFSTDYVFEGNKVDANNQLASYFEDDATNPVNEYGKSKLAGELAIQASGCQYLIFRTSWVYSLFGKNFLLSMLNLAKQRDELNIVNDQWGAPTSADWLASTTCTIVQQLIQAQNHIDWWSNHQGLYHITPNGKTSWQGFTKEIMRIATELQLLTKAAPIIHGIPSSSYPTPASRPSNSCLNTNKLAQQFQLTMPTWQDVLKDVLSKTPHVS
jgi:dTDP-4-dehydrorhamnose reductase